MKKYLLLLIGTIFIALMLCTAVSAASYSISANGKSISVKNSYSTSTLKDQVSVYHKTGTYGYGYYGYVKTTGKNIKGTKTNRTAVYFNKNRNYFTNNDFKYGTLVVSNPDGYWASYSTKVSSTKTMSETYKGRINNELKFSGKATYTLYYVNGQRLVKNGTSTAKFYNNSVLYATVNMVYVPTYRLIQGYYFGVKESVTTKTSYANGDTRKSTISSLYTRNSNGIVVGKKTTGKSSGTEIISGKKVTYTGEIKVTTKYDSKDTWNERYVDGDYYETRTSTASKLKRVVPIEFL